MDNILKWAALALAVAAPAAALAEPPARSQAESAQRVVDGLLEADRGFAAAAANANTLTAISAMFHDEVIMPLPDGGFARGRAAAIEALRANAFNSLSSAGWTPIRGGVSADGRHG